MLYALGTEPSSWRLLSLGRVLNPDGLATSHSKRDRPALYPGIAGISALGKARPDEVGREPC